MRLSIGTPREAVTGREEVKEGVPTEAPEGTCAAGMSGLTGRALHTLDGPVLLRLEQRGRQQRHRRPVEERRRVHRSALHPHGRERLEERRHAISAIGRAEREEALRVLRDTASERGERVARTDLHEDGCTEREARVETVDEANRRRRVLDPDGLRVADGVVGASRDAGHDRALRRVHRELAD